MGDSRLGEKLAARGTEPASTHLQNPLLSGGEELNLCCFVVSLPLVDVVAEDGGAAAELGHLPAQDHGGHHSSGG